MPSVNIAYQSDRDPAKYPAMRWSSITLTDADGAPITDAGVVVTGDMGHAGMMPSSGTGEHIGHGQYRVPMRWTMVGSHRDGQRHALRRQHRRTDFEQQVVMDRPLISRLLFG